MAGLSSSSGSARKTFRRFVCTAASGGQGLANWVALTPPIDFDTGDANSWSFTANSFLLSPARRYLIKVYFRESFSTLGSILPATANVSLIGLSGSISANVQTLSLTLVVSDMRNLILREGVVFGGEFGGALTPSVAGVTSNSQPFTVNGSLYLEELD